MYNGYAWGQRPAGTGEFAYKYIAPTTYTYGGGGSLQTAAATALATATAACEKSYAAWAAREPQDAKCLSKAQRQQIIDWCVQSQQGVFSLSTFMQKRDALVKRECAKDACAADVRNMLAATPRLAKCLTARDLDRIRRWCLKWRTGEITTEQTTRWTTNLINERCATAVVPSYSTTATTPTPSPAPSPADGGGTPTPGDVLPSGGEVHDEGGGGAPVSEPSLLRQYGPVVGIGLLIALGLTIASQKKKKKRR
jgi:hypothetical protein